MKKVLIGVANNLEKNIQKITLWSKSYKMATDGEVVLILANGNDDDVKICEDLKIQVHLVTIENSYFFNHERLKHTLDYLKSSEFDVFLITDVFDVAFQEDPYVLMDFDKYDIFASGEGLNVNQEPWNMDNISKIFPEYIKFCIDKEIINSGIIGGKKASLINLYDQMYSLCESGTNEHNIKDQAAFNVLIHMNKVPRLKIFNLDEGWAQHCAVSGPTDFFESWGFKNNIKYGIPKMIGDTVCTSSGIPFKIVHQFNRVPDWHNLINLKFKIIFEKDDHR